ncbi:unnamed protein product [Caenorhabditis auriculariae]|uniref:Uncharacterized protein n=1 Tax=Caenorhabditis auriculariae TaxID=2777116 RepID=A0A8S1GSM0_9PELO|nr:unnamed protein product [Caenorhabditis auriculariae]
MNEESMSTKSDDGADPGYYVPKNILNPAMFRLEEITKALCEANVHQHCKGSEEGCITIALLEEPPLSMTEERKPISFSWVPDKYDKALIIAIIGCLALFLILLMFATD